MVSNKELELLSLKAAEEIGETGSNLAEVVENIKKCLEENYGDLRLPPNPDEFLLRFLRGSKFDISLASKKICEYFKILNQLKDIHHLLNSSSVESLFRNGVITVFKERDSKGRIVGLYKQEFLPPTPDWVEVGTAALFMVIDYLHRISVDTQRIGFVFVADLSGYSWSHTRHINPGLAMLVAKFATQAFSGRIKGVHFVRNPAIFSYLMTLVKPFLSKKIKSRLQFHGWNFQSLQKYVEPKSLPKYLGGEVADDECGDGEIFSKLVAEDEYYKDLVKFGYSK